MNLSVFANTVTYTVDAKYKFAITVSFASHGATLSTYLAWLI